MGLIHAFPNCTVLLILNKLSPSLKITSASSKTMMARQLEKKLGPTRRATAAWHFDLLLGEIDCLHAYDNKCRVGSLIVALCQTRPCWSVAPTLFKDMS